MKDEELEAGRNRELKLLREAENLPTRGCATYIGEPYAPCAAGKEIARYGYNPILGTRDSYETARICEQIRIDGDGNEIYSNYLGIPLCEEGELSHFQVLKFRLLASIHSDEAQKSIMLAQTHGGFRFMDGDRKLLELIRTPEVLDSLIEKHLTPKLEECETGTTEAPIYEDQIVQAKKRITRAEHEISQIATKRRGEEVFRRFMKLQEWRKGDDTQEMKSRVYHTWRVLFSHHYSKNQRRIAGDGWIVFKDDIKKMVFTDDFQGTEKGFNVQLRSLGLNVLPNNKEDIKKIVEKSI